MTRSGRLALFLSLIFIASAALRAPAAAQNPGGTDDLTATMNRLSLKLPMNVYTRDPIRRHAVTALMRYSETCDGHAPSLRTAVNILLMLTDYGTAVVVSSKLIELEP